MRWLHTEHAPWRTIFLRHSILVRRISDFDADTRTTDLAAEIPKAVFPHELPHDEIMDIQTVKSKKISA